MRKNKIDLSIIVPLYNEEKRFPKSFVKIDRFFRKIKLNKEYIFVDDGSRDETYEIAMKIKSKVPIKVIRSKVNQGKGSALKKGVMMARGKNIFFTDADLSTPMTEFKKIYPLLEEYDLVIGSRRLSNSKVHIKQPFHRRFLGKIFYIIFSMFFTRVVEDTNCGFKCYRASLAKRVFKKMTNKRWGFDAEIVYIAERSGYKIKEVPVVWLNDSNSRVSSVRASLGTLAELLRIKLNEAKGRYGKAIYKKEPALYVLVNGITRSFLMLFFGVVFHFGNPQKKNKIVNKAINLYGGTKDFEGLFTMIRLWDAPYEKLIRLIPNFGQVIDLGCGDGFLANYSALLRKKANFLGIELNTTRVEMSDKGIKNARFLNADILKHNFPKADTILLIHVLHHLPTYKDQERLLRKCFRKINNGGRILIVEIVERPLWKYIITWLVDAIVVPVLFEGRFFSTDFHYRKSDEWVELLSNVGFKVKAQPVDQGKIFSHLLLVATK